MKLNKLLFAALVLGGIAMTSCSKDKSIAPATAAAKKLAKFYNANAISEVTDFTYDSKGRLITQVGPYSSAEFSYTNNVLSAVLKLQNGWTYFTYTNGKLDNAGRITEIEGLYTPQNNPSTSQYKYLFEYDAEGHLTKFTNRSLPSGDESVEKFIYQDGNVVKEEGSNNGVTSYTSVYEYFDNQENKLNLDLAPQVMNFFTDGLTGKRSKNLLKTFKNFDNNNVLNIDRQYDYQFDAEGYPTSLYYVNLLNNTSYNRTLVYDK